MELKLKFTDKERTSYELILGDDNLSKGYVKLRNTLTGEEKLVELSTAAAAVNTKDNEQRPYTLCSIH